MLRIVEGADRLNGGKSWGVRGTHFGLLLSHQLTTELAGTILCIFAVLIPTEASAWANKWPLTSTNLANYLAGFPPQKQQTKSGLGGCSSHLLWTFAY